ncbi:hypothetical protein I4I73_15135, partial [Pseudonocardia sp. KRD-184]
PTYAASAHQQPGGTQQGYGPPPGYGGQQGYGGQAGYGGSPGTPPARRNRLPLVLGAAALVVALVVAGIVFWPRGSTPTGTDPVASGSSDTGGVTGGDPAVTPASPSSPLLARLEPEGFYAETCTGIPITDGATEQIRCTSNDTTAVPILVFQQFGDVPTYAGSLATVDTNTTGEDEDCAIGGDTSVEYAGYDLVCGTTTFEDGTTGYVVAWGTRTSMVQGFAAGPDPAAVYTWWLSNTPF